MQKFAICIREWYSYHFPELVKIVLDNFIFAKAAKFIKDRKTLTHDKLDELKEIVMDSAKAQAIIDAAKMSIGLSECLKELSTYLHNKSLIGDQVGTRLISHAGSLSPKPKYGLLHNSSFIGPAGLKNKGRISRFLANIRSIASRIDCFFEQTTQVFGDALKQQVEERLKFYESGEVPSKNIEVTKPHPREASSPKEEKQEKEAYA
uniref:Nop domain-containing protein n=1 Tax=Stomoxys calcitrans TaxID=35570 RepID=A0A1I8Q530_STOCA